MKRIPDLRSPIAPLVALAAFALVAAFIFDDYGISFDGTAQRDIGIATLDYVLGDDYALADDLARFYGVAFEVPLIIVERLLPLDSARERYLSRHLATHLFFLAAGFFAWLLAYRLFGSRLVALFAMLIFLLHPRVYAHSFYNSKDLPFLSMFMIALYLTHRAFRRDSVWAFALCGASAGLLINIRVMGVILPPVVLGMLALDAVRAARREGGGDVKGVLANAGAFVAASAATLYATWPMLWREPLGLIDAFRLISNHPTPAATLFRGEFVRWPNIPWDYIPTWILITTPPIALMLAAVGTAYLARLCAARRRDPFADPTARFGLLALACLILPVAAVILLNSNLHNGWRQMYFLYAPLCVLSAFGLRALLAIPKPTVRAAAFALAALGIAAAAVQMVRLHPYQNDYFNLLADKRGLANRWQLDYWNIAHREAIETLLKIQPTGRIAVSGHEIHIRQNGRLIPNAEMRRLYTSHSFPSYRILIPIIGEAAPEETIIWKREVYGVPIIAIQDARAESAAAFRAALESASATEPSESGGGFELYEDGGALIYIKEACGEEDARSRFWASIFPVDPADLPPKSRNAGLGYEPLNFDFHRHGAARGGDCVIIPDLPDYPISHLETGQYIPGESGMWSARIIFDGYADMFRLALSSLSGAPAARSGFDIWLDGGALIYIKEACAEADARGRFFLSIFPQDANDLSQSARDAELEHEPLNFDFHQHGAIFDGKCAIIRNLPDYPISRIQTGQWIPGEGELWNAEIVVGD